MKAKKTSKKRKKKSSGKRLWWLWGGIAIVALALGLSTWWYERECRARYQGEETRIYIPKGSTEDAIADTLNKNLGEEYGRRVMRIWRWRDGSPSRSEGSYVVTPGTPALEFSRRLLTGNQDPVRMTFNNVRTMEQLAERVAHKLDFSADDFLAACDSVLPEMGFTEPQYPAAFLPDTYEFYWNAAPTYVVKRLADTRNKFWTPERRQQAATLNLTPEEVAVVASIVEEETAKKDERQAVARLYLNRLKKHMRLQADPTVKFAVGDFSLRRITGKHLQVQSPYNTYLVDGLPPGPIRIVERSTLDDVLVAPEHDYIYMCAKEDFSGYHNFATTGAEHAANARRYHEALNRRNIH